VAVKGHALPPSRADRAYQGTYMTQPAGTAGLTSNSSTALPQALQKALSRITEISSLPEITTRIVQVVEDPKSTAQDMHEIVRTDPALATKILKVVNSAFYGLPSQIANLDRAIVMLGLSAVKNIALAASLSRLFRPGAITEKFDATDLWAHCVSVGVCARLLAQAGGGTQVEEAFVGGLVHDVGLLIEYQLFPEQVKTIVERVERGEGTLPALEQETFGADHQAIGAYLASKWKFPPALRSAISYHHNPQMLQPALRRFVTTITVADTICCQNEIAFHLTARHQEVDEGMLAEIGLTVAKVGEVLEALPERIAEANAIFKEEHRPGGRFTPGRPQLPMPCGARPWHCPFSERLRVAHSRPPRVPAPRADRARPRPDLACTSACLRYLATARSEGLGTFAGGCTPLLGCDSAHGPAPCCRR
jgi:putative nucleotidyltransferase with HDIG domain